MDSKGKSKGFGRCSIWGDASKKSCEEQNAVAIDDEWQPRRWDVVLMQNKDRHKGRRRKMKSQSERRRKRKEKNRIGRVKQLRRCVHPLQTSFFLSFFFSSFNSFYFNVGMVGRLWPCQLIVGQENQLQWQKKGSTQGSGCVHTAHFTCLRGGGGFFNLSMQ